MKEGSLLSYQGLSDEAFPMSIYVNSESSVGVLLATRGKKITAAESPLALLILHQASLFRHARHLIPSRFSSMSRW